MAVGVDMAGAVAPAPAAPAPRAEVRADRTGRSGQAHAAKATGAKGLAAKRADADDAAEGFDAQLDAALPDADDPQRSSTPKAGKGRQATAKPADDVTSADRQRDAAPAAVVLTPWTFMQPASVATPKGDGATGAAEPAKAGKKTADADTPATDATAGAAVPVAADVTAVAAAAIAGTIVPGAVAPDAAAAPDAGQTKVAAANQAQSAPANGSARRATSMVAVEADAASVTDGAGLKNVDRTGGSDAKATADVKATPDAKGAASPDASVAEAIPGKPEAQQDEAQQPAQLDGVTHVAPAPRAAEAAPAAQPQQAAVPAAPPADVPAAPANAPAAANAAPAMSEVQRELRAVGQASAADAASARPAHAARGEKLAPGGRATNTSPRSGTRIDASASAGPGKEPHTPRVDASANVGSVDERRGSAPQDNPATSATQAFSAPKAADVPVHQDAHGAAVIARDGQATTMPVGAVAGPAGATLPEVVMSGDVPAMASSDVPDADTPHRLVQSLRMQFQRGGGDAIVQLSPEHLGPVTISLKVEQGSVEARITASNPVVAEWLQAHHESLREGLQANGLTLDRLHVDKDGQSPDRRERRETPQRQRFRQPSESQSTFELTI